MRFLYCAHEYKNLYSKGLLEAGHVTFKRIVNRTKSFELGGTPEPPSYNLRIIGGIQIPAVKP